MVDKPEERRGLQWKRVEDFSAGIHYDTGLAFAEVLPGNASGAYGDYPPGSADPYGTYNCMARPTGGLAPLAKMTSTQTVGILGGAAANITNVSAATHAVLTITGAPFKSGQVVTLAGIVMTGVTAPSGNFILTFISGSNYSIIYNTVGGTYVSGGTATPYLGANTVVGLFTAHDQLNVAANETIVSFEYDDGSSHFANVWSLQSGTSTFTNILSFNGNSAGSNVFGSPYPSWSRMANSAPTTTPGQPVLVFPLNPDANQTGLNAIYVYPDPATPNLYPPLNLTTGSGVANVGQVIAHQNRILTFGVSYFAWPPVAGASDLVTNEVINFTDPPNGITMVNAQTYFGIEEPFGYGASGSISAGELFLVKQRGGGLVVSGDIVSPTVTFFPGIQPTGAMYGRADSGPAGLFYGSNAQGYWNWNGGNTSTKISNQLDNGFFTIPDWNISAGNSTPTNFGFYTECVGDKVYVSNNWVYDTVTNSWWTYFPRPGQDPNHTGYNLYWYSNVDGEVAYAAPLTFTSADTHFSFRFDQTLPSAYWSWKSNPIILSQDRLIDVRELLFRFSSSPESINPTAQITVYSGGNVVGSVSTNAGQITHTPTSIRCPIGPGVTAGSNAYAAQDLTFHIYATDGTAAPILHWIDIGYRERQHIPTTGVPS